MLGSLLAFSTEMIYLLLKELDLHSEAYASQGAETRVRVFAKAIARAEFYGAAPPSLV